MSLIIPVFNVDKFISKLFDKLLLCLDSRTELIVIDDGSNDLSGKISKDYQAKFLSKGISFKFIKQENCGLSASRNKGIKLASGKYIKFFDSDDLFGRKYFDDIMFFLKDDADLVIQYFAKLDEDNLKKLFTIPEEKVSLNSSKLINMLLRNELPIAAWSYTVKKEILTKNNLYFSIGRKFEDINHTIKVISLSKRIVIRRSSRFDHLYWYRSRKGSIMNRTSAGLSDSDFNDFKFVISDEFSFIEKIKENSSEIIARELNNDQFIQILNYYFYFLKKECLNREQKKWMRDFSAKYKFPFIGSDLKINLKRIVFKFNFLSFIYSKLYNK
ncbi:hypothetical protein ATW92_09565 [Oenococcus oeni]|uniref:glycosyltransferase n=2 Tax=Oenococcus oeni TaxID=1247 RepID=UPI0008F92380|nr:glycosyltransferase [Oenococcus oeni]OIL07644.1 hypothetical protein ATW92_09565 [Oenococcus oeni]